ncbi:MAG: glucose-6-phosphate isomerase, partial [Lachnospiraceae bacterium]|nr:glucose-6-phosphate isomerase [Lachnospiraceae bacterium]
MSRLKLDCTKACDLIAAEEYEALKADALAARTALAEKTGAGNDFLGWVDLPVEYDREEFARIKFAADRIRSDSDALVVIGIGGSYLGARAAIEFLGKNFANQLSKEERGGPEIYFAGNNISTAYLADLLKVLEGKDISINVISKSGTTTEPSIAFRVFKKLMEERYGREGAAKRIYATTDKARGALKSLADDEGYETFVVPDDVGGRYCVLTAVGLLPIAVAGADLDRLMAGAQAMREQALTADPGENAALQYAIVRNALYRKGYDIEIMSNYEPPLHYIAEWWKQLYGESEGKDGLGIFPASVDLTADLHSMGQYIQDGRRALMETVLHVENVRGEIIMSEEENDLDG